MKTASESNAITQRLELLQSFWQEFRDNTAAKCCHWRIVPDEMSMMETFYEVEQTEHGRFPDFLLRFDTNFTDPIQYEQALNTAFRQFLRTEQEACEDNAQLSAINDALRQSSFFTALHVFSKALSDFETGLLVAWLDPGQIKDAAAWEQWLAAAIRTGLPPKVRLMLVDDQPNDAFARIRAAHPDAFITYTPGLDMPAALRQLATAGNPENPGVKYRLHFLALGQAAAKGDFETMQSEGMKAVNIAQQQSGWEHLEVAAYVAMGNAMMKEKSRQQAVRDYFDKACSSGERAIKSGNPTGPVVWCQAMFAKGAALVSTKDFQAAATVYEAIGPVAKTIKNGEIQQMEAWRMAGYCHEQNRRDLPAWECNYTAFEAAEQLDEQIRANSTLPYIGVALTRLSDNLGKHRELAAIKQKLDQWIGADWHLKTQHNHQTV